MSALKNRLTLDDIKQWPAAVDAADGARALGVSRAHAYASIREGSFPAKTIKVGGRIKVITASLIELLEGGGR